MKNLRNRLWKARGAVMHRRKRMRSANNISRKTKLRMYESFVSVPNRRQLKVRVVSIILINIWIRDSEIWKWLFNFTGNCAFFKRYSQVTAHEKLFCFKYTGICAILPLLAAVIRRILGRLYNRRGKTQSNKCNLALKYKDLKFLLFRMTMVCLIRQEWTRRQRWTVGYPGPSHSRYDKKLLNT